MPVNILVVENEPATRELIAASLSRSGHHVVPAATTRAAQAFVRSALPDLVLLDGMLPENSGYEFARRLRADEPTRDIPIVMLTPPVAELPKAHVASGADAYVRKPFSPGALVARIRSVLRRRAPRAVDGVIELGGLRLDPSAHRVFAGDAALSLRPNEFRMLHFLLSHPERVHSRGELLERVWGGHAIVEERTVDVHMHRLRAVLAATGLDGRIQTVRGAGYRFSTIALAGRA